MCRSTERKTPFVPKVLTEAEKLRLQRGSYVKHSITNHSANGRGLSGWTDAHKQAWELDQMDRDRDE